ncbi:hypothetical protein BSKO_03367 [Bryopsis sp. KO-2023]|nr:hypothetical protein BSKO_03367 [Bryopsis sp. KO-2023]
MRSMHLALVCAVAWATVAVCSANLKFKILHFNDFHARIEPDSEGHGHCFSHHQDEGRCHGGMARMKTLIDEERKDDLPMYILNAGDDFVGTEWNTQYKGKANAHFMKKLGITAMTLGNHEFDWGPDVLLDFVKSIDYPVISSNFKANGHPLGEFVKDYITIDVNGTKVGICGPSTQYTNTGSKPWPGEMTKWFPAAKRCVWRLRHREKAKIVIVLTHVGFDGDQKIARHIGGVDLVIGGHTHAFLYSGTAPLLSKKAGTRDWPVGEYPTWVESRVKPGTKVPVVQAKAFGRYVGRIVMEFDKKGNLLEFDGYPMLMGDEDSERPVAMDGDIEKEVKEWRKW